MELLIAGGDRRHLLLGELARARGWRVMSLGLPGASAGAGRADVAVLPAPYAKGGYINAPLVSDAPRVEELEAHLKPGARVYAGSPDEALCALARAQGWQIIDLYADEAFARRNALASAEGAVFAAMRERDALIAGERCLVTGFGRLGQMIALTLKGLGARVRVAARREASRALAQCMGLEAVDLGALPIALKDVRLIFNTVPARLLDARALKCVDAGALIIETASAPYGVDFDAARELGVRALRESGIPGRYCPRTAAALILDALEAAGGDIA